MSQRLFSWLIILGTISLCYYTPVTSSGMETTSSLRYRPEFLLYPVAALLSLLSLSRCRVQSFQAARPLKTSMYAYCLFVFSCCLSTLLAAVFLDIPFNRLGAVSLYSFAGCFLLAWAVWREMTISETWRIRMASSLALVPMLPVLLTGIWFLNNDAADTIVHSVLRVPIDQPFIGEDGRFYGLAANPAQSMDMCIVATGFVWIALIAAFKERRLKRAIILLVYLAGITVVALWSGVRSGFIALAVVFVFGSFLLVRKTQQVGRMLLSLAVIAALIVASFIAMPATAKLSLAIRMTDDNRSGQWTYYTSLVPSLPFGAGACYEDRYLPPSRPFIDERMPPHNEFLAAWMTAGLPGLCLMGVFLVGILGWAYRRARLPGPFDAGQIVEIGCFVAFVGLWTSHLFIDMPFREPLHSVLLATMLGAGGSRHYSAGSLPAREKS